MGITIEEMKDTLVESEIDYIIEMVNRDRYDDLFEFVYLNCFSNFKSMSDEEIKEQYEWRYDIFEEEKS
tara:strand:- start:305 stop:511 length:207 start_codon:yes stop_codon:yes gene_type:complete